MALSYTRLLCRRSLDLHQLRGLYTTSLLKTTAAKSAPASPAVCESHDEKNMRLKRPMSPHLTIYQVQLTALLSITHRATGMVLSSYAMLFGLGTLFVPGGMPCVIDTIHSLCLPSAVLFVSKYILALPATYHFFNGIRHLCWDLGMFLTIKQVYSTGYTVVALGIVSALALACL
ncbi:succinate dehydrogenase cytochrome b560 subunit, mitochondrial [Orussus abietinus]|uniref:succinate dehydrogenase cytochrome b560 subunit, mitochondrial n=1 Tax=Orussus abietinus TaxID=222816 RepID=UPI00062603E4|nr:succinate dehydrogenase cytochrome b560 subunit, mitochondrial [Orussus abietinus]